MQAAYQEYRAQDAAEELDRRHCGCWDSLSSAGDALPVLDIVAEEMAAAGYPEADRFGLRLALEEAIVNAIHHGNRGDPSRRVHVRFDIGPDRVLAEVEDEGEGFDPARVPDPLAPENRGRPSGHGLLLMRHYTTWLRYNWLGNCVTLCKDRSG
jgi:serine/threonine-protein kinase RsbW